VTRVRHSPWAIKLSLAALLALQVWVSWQQARPTAKAEGLPSAPAIEMLRAVSVGEPVVLGQALTLWLQSFDNQPGISLPYVSLDYQRVEGWLDRLLDLDPATHYPLMMATQLYGQVPDLGRDRVMYDFVLRGFLQDPNRRWSWLAHATIMAKHRLKDPQLALNYADALARHATGSGVPGWARQMHIFLREEMGEIESAKVLLGGLLESGQVTDEQEKRFLIERLNAMQQGEISSTPSTTRPLD